MKPAAVAACDAVISYLDAGSDPPLVLLHGIADITAVVRDLVDNAG